MTQAFQDIPASADAINSNYTWKQIEAVQDTATASIAVNTAAIAVNTAAIVVNTDAIDNQVFHSVARDFLVVADEDNTYDADVNNDVVLVGTNLTNNLSNNVINVGNNSEVEGGLNIIDMGSNSDVTNSDSVVNIGRASDVDESDNIINIGGNSNIINADNVINIGIDTDVTGDNNIIVGQDNDKSGANNIIIGHQLAAGLAINNVIMISDQALSADVATNGSLIFGGGHNSSKLPRIQFLKNSLTNLQGQAFGNYFGEGGTFAIPNISGYMRIKYKGQNLLIPCLPDPDDDNPSPIVP